MPVDKRDLCVRPRDASTTRSCATARAPPTPTRRPRPLGDEREATLAALARLHEQAGRWGAAVEALEKLARATREPRAARTVALVRAAAITSDAPRRRAAAEARYVRALEVDPANVGALTALAALYRLQGEHLRAAKLMREAEARTANRIEKVRLLHDLGVLLPGRARTIRQAAAEL